MRWLLPITNDESTNSIDAKTMAAHHEFYRTPRCNFKKSEKAQITFDYVTRHINHHLNKSKPLNEGKHNTNAKYQLNLALGWLVNNAHQLPQEDINKYQTAILRTYQSVCSVEEKGQFLNDHFVYARLLQDEMIKIKKAKLLKLNKSSNKNKAPDKIKDYTINIESIDCILGITNLCFSDYTSDILNQKKDSNKIMEYANKIHELKKSLKPENIAHLV